MSSGQLFCYHIASLMEAGKTFFYSLSEPDKTGVKQDVIY